MRDDAKRPDDDAAGIEDVERWRANVYEPATRRFGEREPQFITSSESEVKPLYTADNLADWNAQESLGFPGVFPYTRGVQPTMYRGKLWTMRQYAGYATAE